MRNYLNKDCQVFLDRAFEHYQLCLEFFVLLEDHFISYGMLTYEKNIQMTLVHTKFVHAISDKLGQLVLLEQQMVEKINQEREAIMRGMEEMADKIEIIKSYSSLEGLNESYVFTNRSYLTV